MERKNQFRLRGKPHVRISFLDNKGMLRKRSGLNWGQRPEYNRNPNQAYMRVPKVVNDSNFFPDIGVRFVIHTDDNEVLRVTRAQANGKAIETFEDNSILGSYFRKRLGLAYGLLVKKEDLQRYGRTHVDFYKIDDHKYFMDFSRD